MRSVLDTIRSYGLTPEELRARAELAFSHGQRFLGRLYLDEAEAQEVVRRYLKGACDFCGGRGMLDDIPCPRCERIRVEVKS